MNNVKQCFFRNSCKDYNSKACNQYCYPFLELYGVELPKNSISKNNVRRMVIKEKRNGIEHKHDFVCAEIIS